MNNELPNNLDEVEIGDELYIIRPKGAEGVTDALGIDPVRFETDENILGPYVFGSRLDGIRFLQFLGLDNLDRWEVVSSKEFGGNLSLLKKASSNFTHVVVDPLFRRDAPVVSVTIEDAIRIFESRQAKKSNSGGRQRPFRLLTKREDNGSEVLRDETAAGVEGVCLFKTEMEAEEYINSYGLSDEWEADGPVNPVNGIDFLERLCSMRFSYVVINPPLSGGIGFTATPIKVVIAHLKKKGHIRDLA